jgi:hypothetical protein
MKNTWKSAEIRVSFRSLSAAMLMRFLVFCLFCLSMWHCLPAQPPQTIGTAEGPTQYFDLILVRGSLLHAGQVDTARLLSPASGTLFVGSGVRVRLIKELLSLHLQPGMSGSHLVYRQESGQRFPSDSAFEKEKHFLLYGELPIGLQLRFPTSATGRQFYQIEAGVFGGYLISGSYKTTYENALGQRVRQRIKPARDVYPFRYGWYGRIGYDRWMLQFSYRLSDFFEPFRSRSDGSPSTFRNPVFPPIELGIGIRI